MIVKKILNSPPPIRASSYDVNMVFDERDGVGLRKLWTADERQFKVESYIDGDLDWTGYVIPNGFNYSFTGGLYYAQITASDGLGTLEDYIFRDETNNKPYGNSDLTYNDGFYVSLVTYCNRNIKKLDP